jgi:hypothetical protein
LNELHKTALDAAARLLEVAPAAAQSHVTMWHVMSACKRPREAAAVVQAALAPNSPLHMHPSLLHVAISDPAVSSETALSSAICLLGLDPCHPAPAAYVASAAADGRMSSLAAAEALAATLDTTTPLPAQTWEIVCLRLGLLMWHWKEETMQEWLGWRFEWWPRLHLSNAGRQICDAASADEQRIVACKALLALLLQGPSSNFHSEFVRSCSDWAAAAWLHQAQLQCSKTDSGAAASVQELRDLSFSSSSDESCAKKPRHYSSAAAAASSSRAQSAH